MRNLDPARFTRGPADDRRLGACLVDVDWDVAIVGHGSGPAAIRTVLYALTTGLSGELDKVRVHDAGDAESDAELEQAVASLASADQPVVVLGGSTAASHAGLLAATRGRVAIVNISSQPAALRPAFERSKDRLASITSLGAQAPHASRAGADWLRANRGRLVPLEELRTAPGVVERLKRELDVAAAPVDLLTLVVDPDAFTGPAPDGFAPHEGWGLFERSGRHPKARLLHLEDASEDRARLAAECVWRFVAGVVKRG